MKNKTRFQVRLNNESFTCYLDLRHRKNLNLTIKANNVLMISKPNYVNKKHLLNYLNENSEMITEKSKSINELIFKRNNYINSETIKIFNQKYDFSEKLLESLNHILETFVKEISCEYDKLIKEKVTVEIKPLVNKWGVAYPHKGLIVLNEKLVHYPKACIKYVLLHEYMHFNEANHSPRFYKLIEKVMPDYKEQIAYLKNN